MGPSVSGLDNGVWASLASTGVEGGLDDVGVEGLVVLEAELGMEGLAGGEKGDEVGGRAEWLDEGELKGDGEDDVWRKRAEDGGLSMHWRGGG